MGKGSSIRGCVCARACAHVCWGSNSPVVILRTWQRATTMLCSLVVWSPLVPYLNSNNCIQWRYPMLKASEWQLSTKEKEKPRLGRHTVTEQSCVADTPLGRQHQKQGKHVYSTLTCCRGLHVIQEWHVFFFLFNNGSLLLLDCTAVMTIVAEINLWDFSLKNE